MGNPVIQQLSTLINLATIDNELADKETKMIYKIGQANGLTEEEVQELVQKPHSTENLDLLTPDQKFEYLYSIVQLMKIDGKVFKSEIVYCQELAAKLGYKESVIAELSSKIYSDPSITADRETLKARVQKYLK